MDAKELKPALNMAVDTAAHLRPDQHGYHWALAMLRQGQLLTHIALSICDNSSEFHRSLDRAEACFHQSLQVFFNQPHPRYWAFLQKCLADVDFYRCTNDKHSPYLERAIQGYNFALEVLSATEWPSDSADMQMKLCSLYRRREHGEHHDNLSRAISHGVDAVNMLSTADVADELSQAQLTLAKAYERQSRVTEAVHFYSEALKANTVVSCATVDNSMRLLQCLLTMPRPSLSRATSCLAGIRRDMQDLRHGPAINKWRRRTKVRTMAWEGVLLTKRQTRQGVNAEECERGIALLKAVLRDSNAGISLRQTANIYLGELFLLRRSGCSFENAEAAVACYVDALQRMPCASPHAQQDLERGRGKLWILLGDALWYLYSLKSQAIKDDANEGAVLDYLCKRTIDKAMMAYALAEKCTQRRQTYAQACMSRALAALERQDEGDAWMAVRLSYQALRTLKLEGAELKLWLKGCAGLYEAANALLAGLDSPRLQAHRGCRLDSALPRPRSPRVMDEFFLEGPSSTCALCELNTCKAALKEAVRVVPAKAQLVHAADVMPAVDALYCALTILSDALHVSKSVDIELTDVELMTETLLRPLIIRQRASSEAVGLPSETVTRLLRESVGGPDSIDDDVIENVLRDISGELSVFASLQPLTDFRRLVDL
jgi:tetratricopeptide (TPR) repeat protein